MVGTLSVKISSSNVNIPLKTIFAYVNSPTTLKIIDVPKKIGKWAISKVVISASYPDNSIVSAECVLTGGCYTGTLQPSTSVGKSFSGLTISASGTDENGNNIEGLILGKSDIVILDADGRTIINGKVTYLHLLDTTPEDPKEGDVIFDENWKIYHNDEWIDFGTSTIVWGNITGDITQQSDLIDKFDSVDDNVEIVKSDVRDLSSNLLTTQNELSEVKDDVAGIKSKIPNAASTSNQLADKAFVNSSINNYAAFYLTKNINGDAFGSYAELSSATQFYNGGLERTPTKNDYCVVLEDETKTTSLGVNPTTRYTYQGVYPDGQWEFQYIVNNTSLTQAQVDAINSGITTSKVQKIDTIQDYTPLSTFNATVGNLATIIQGI